MTIGSLVAMWHKRCTVALSGQVSKVLQRMSHTHTNTMSHNVAHKHNVVVNLPKDFSPLLFFFIST